MSVDNLIYLVIGIVAGGLITWIVQHVYSREPSRLLKRIDSRDRAEFIAKHDEDAEAFERPDGNYSVKFWREVGGTVAPEGTLSARVMRADGSVEDLGVLGSELPTRSPETVSE